ncbi:MULTISPECIES: hypothetical protein [unclassified Microbulbifer]|uniref:hypothetical protein n=1 Tax=unclassified Microbulbifer TaxID=2619833 RepID=UPI0027E4D7A4|nr:MULTISPECIES: hypothetical protein [unclassified Microbulbifer]
MREFLRNLSFSFTAGALGGLCYLLALWLMGRYGFMHWVGVDLGYGLSRYFIYHYVIWGGICGLIFLLPWRRSWVSRGFFLSLVPAGILLLLLMPMQGNGLFALYRGALAPLVVVLACAAGGIAASGLLRAQGK